MRSQKSPCAPLKPNSLGSCVLARNSATPHLKPTSTVSEKKLTMAPARDRPGHEGDQRDQQRRARRERGVAGGSPPAISPSDAPTSSEIAEVTVTAVWRELQNSQKTSPPNRHA